jgi:hypothetical protein
LEDARDPTPVTAAASRTRSPRIDPNRLTLRQSTRGADRGRNPVWNDPPGPHRAGRESFFDPDYAAFRRNLQSLASDGHRLVKRVSGNAPGATGRQVRRFLRRIDRFDELAAARGLEPVRRWAHRLRSIVLEFGKDR